MIDTTDKIYNVMRNAIYKIKTAAERSCRTNVFLLFTAIMCLAMMMIPALPVRASSGSSTADSGVYDGADLLSSDEERSLSDEISSYTEKYSCDIAIVTTDSTDGKSTQDYADTYAEDLGMSMTRNGYPGILYLIDMDNRQIYISTSGQAIDYFTDSRINSILDDCYDDVSNENYYDSCSSFLEGTARCMGVSPGISGRMTAAGALIRLVIALAIGGIVTFVMVRRSGGAVTTSGATYINDAASRVTGRTDRFINRTVTHRVIEHDDDDSGGSSTHTSSGGGVHGGGGRSF